MPDESTEKKAPLPTALPMVDAMRAARSQVCCVAVTLYWTNMLTAEATGATRRACLIRERQARAPAARPTAVIVSTSRSRHGGETSKSASGRPSLSVFSQMVMSPRAARARTIRGAEAEKAAARPSASSRAWRMSARDRGRAGGNRRAPHGHRDADEVHRHATCGADRAADAMPTVAASITASCPSPMPPAVPAPWTRWRQGRRPHHQLLPA